MKKLLFLLFVIPLIGLTGCQYEPSLPACVTIANLTSYSSYVTINNDTEIRIGPRSYKQIELELNSNPEVVEFYIWTMYYTKTIQRTIKGYGVYNLYIDIDGIKFEQYN
jgi:hypothetical protein